MDERAQEKLHKESLKGIIDSITLKKREANGLHQVHNPILNAEKMLFDDRETRWNGQVVGGCQKGSVTVLGYKSQRLERYRKTEVRPLDSEF